VAEAKRLRIREHDEWARPELAAIARVLQETTGLVFPPNRREPAEAGIRRAMHQLGMDASELRAAIATPGDARDALVTELTVGETFFFREAGQLEFFRDRVLPEMREKIGTSRPLRIWSAGCATGEEPYTLAMVLRDAAWPGPVQLLGTDIVPARLAVARRGRYTKWSMRGVPDDDIQRHFERRGEYYFVRDEIRRAVDFRVLNFADDMYPSPAAGLAEFDVIFCRNVLIYFDPPAVESIARRLLASLAPDGWLFLGASDPSIADFATCEVVLTGAGLAYRPLADGAKSRVTTAGDSSRHFGGGADTAQQAPPAFASSYDLPTPAVDMPNVGPLRVPAAATLAISEFEPSPAIPVTAAASSPADPGRVASLAADALLAGAAEKAYAHGDYDAAATAAQAAIERGESSERTWVLLVRSHANAGRLSAAGEAVAAALERHQLSSELRYLEGMLLAQAGRRTEAVAAFRRALYLDPAFAVAHLALGESLAANGDAGGARRAYTNAAAALRDVPPDAILHGADGTPAARLLHIARFHLQPSLNGKQAAAGAG
jgi:chemotaxis protein methyltransferase CheR